MLRTVDAEIELLFTGLVFCDLVFASAPHPQPGTEVYADAFAVSAGGTANRAVAAARMGARTTIAADLGTDAFGDLARNLLSAERTLDTRFLRRREGWHTPVTVALTSAHDRSFVTYEEASALPEWDVEGPDVGAAHVGLRTLPDWARALRARGTIIVAGVGWDETGRWAASELDALADVDVFILNEIEACSYTGVTDPVAAARSLGERVPLVIVTRGPAGAVAIDSARGEMADVPAVIVPALDPTGAGDVFTGTFMATLTDDLPLAARLQIASLGASLSVRSLGGAASAPRPAEVLQFIQDSRPVGEWTDVVDWVSTRTAKEEKAS